MTKIKIFMYIKTIYKKNYNFARQIVPNYHRVNDFYKLNLCNYEKK